MSAIVFGSPEAERVRRRIAALERLDTLPVRIWEVSGEVKGTFNIEVEARTKDEACAKVNDMYPHDLCEIIEDIDISHIRDAGLAHPDDPEEQAKEAVALNRANEVKPAQTLL